MATTIGNGGRTGGLHNVFVPGRQDFLLVVECNGWQVCQNQAPKCLLRHRRGRRTRGRLPGRPPRHGIAPLCACRSPPHLDRAVVPTTQVAFRVCHALPPTDGGRPVAPTGRGGGGGGRASILGGRLVGRRAFPVGRRPGFDGRQPNPGRSLRLCRRLRARLGAFH